MPEEPRAALGANLDHVMIMVRDLRAASEDFTRLGFRVLPGGRFPAGIENAIVPFGVGGPYLELVGIYQPGGADIRDNEEFLAQGEGAMYVGLEVTSAVETAKRLRDHGLDVQGPAPGSIKLEGMDGPPAVLWQSVAIQHGASLRSDPIFFTEYDRAAQAELMARNPEYARKWGAERRIPHPNGANGLAAVWFAVGDLGSATLQYEAMGFPRAREYAMDRPRSRVVELALGRGSLRLMKSTVPDGPLDKLLTLHSSQLEIPGISLEVSSVEKARDAMPSDLGGALESSGTPGVRGLVIPPDLAHGVWIELLVRPESSV